jgi:hypothetical protein
MVGAAIAALGLEPAARVTSIGVKELPECGTNDEVLAYHGLDVQALTRAIFDVVLDRRRRDVARAAAPGLRT